MPNAQSHNYVGYLFIFLSLSICGISFGQEDTILVRIFKLENDSTRIEELNKTIEFYRRTNMDRAWELAVVQDSLSKRIADPRLIALTRYQFGNLHFQENNFELAIQQLIEAAQLYQKHDPENGKLAGVYNTIAAIYSQRENHKKAIEYYQLALETFEQKNDSLWIGITSLNFSIPYMRLEEFTKAEALLLNADKIFNVPSRQAYRGYSCLNLADNYQQQQKYIKANQYAKLAIKYMPIDRDPKIHSGGHLILARTYQYEGQHPRAIEEFQKGLKIAEEAQYANHVLEASEGLWQSFESIGKEGLAFPYMKTYIAIKDSLRKADEDQRMLDVLKKFEFEKKETEVSLLKEVAGANEQKISQQKFALGGAAIGIGLLSFLLFRIFDQKKNIQKKNAIINTALEEKDVLLREIHHRVKNNLQVVSSLLSIQSRGIKDKKAKEAIQEGRNRVQSMSLIHQNLYKKDNLTGIEMRPYIDKLANHLLHTYQVASGEIEIILEIDEITLDVETVVPIGLIINELISNSLKYAFPNEGNGWIKIELINKTDVLLLTVSDNGIGLNEEQINMKNETFGHTLIRAFKNKLEADIDISGDGGMSVSLLIRNYKAVG